MNVKERLQKLGFTEDQIEDFGVLSINLIEFYVQKLVSDNFTDKELEYIDIYADSNDWDEGEKHQYVYDELTKKMGINVEDKIEEFLNFLIDDMEKNTKVIQGIIEKVQQLPEEEQEKEFDAYLNVFEQMKVNNLKNIKPSEEDKAV